jgi:hypothetical protein
MGASFGMGDLHRMKSFLRNLWGLFKDLLGTDFKAEITTFAPLLVKANGDCLLLFLLFLFHGAFPLWQPPKKDDLVKSHPADGKGKSFPAFRGTRRKMPLRAGQMNFL